MQFPSKFTYYVFLNKLIILNILYYLNGFSQPNLKKLIIYAVFS